MLRIFRHYIPKSLVILGSAEAVIFFLSIYVGVSLRLFDFNPTDKLLVGGVWPKALLYAGVMMALMSAMGLYERGLRDDLRGILFRVSVALLVGLLVMALILWLVPAVAIGTDAFTVAFLCSAAGVVAFRSLVYRLADASLFRRRVLVLGAGRAAAQVARLRRKTDRRDMTLVGFVPVEGEEEMVPPDRIIRANTSLLELAGERRVDEIVVAIEQRRRSFPVNEILDCKMSGIQVIDLVSFFEQQTGKINLEALNPSALIFADGFIQAVLKTSLHRGFDLLVSLTVLAITWPLMAVAAIAILLESGGRGPVLYRQVRVGRNGRPFRIMKFRSMTVDAERDGQARWAGKDDARVTPVGAVLRKTRIDELPQLINVLKGDMSFVGPRPERPQFVQDLASKIPFYDLRHRVNPGITGWAQICYPYGASVRDAREKLQYDLYYIKNYSLFLDLMILVQTAQVILWGKGAR